MRVRMKTHVTGYRNGEPWPERGGCIDLPDHEAADLIAANLAEEASDADHQDHDPVVAPPVEPATDDSEASPADDGGDQGTATDPPVKAPAKKRPAKKAVAAKA